MNLFSSSSSQPIINPPPSNSQRLQLQSNTKLSAQDTKRHLLYLCGKIGIEKPNQMKIRQIQQLISNQGQGFIEYQQLQKMLLKVFKDLQLLQE